jgi:hypothetical protein
MSWRAQFTTSAPRLLAPGPRVLADDDFEDRSSPGSGQWRQASRGPLSLLWGEAGLADRTNYRWEAWPVHKSMANDQPSGAPTVLT